MITDNQTNKIYFSPALEKECPVLWESIHKALMERGVRHGFLMNNPQYFWCRDYMPIQIDDDKFVSYDFKPDYLLEFKKRYRFALDCDIEKICFDMNYPTVRMDLVIDGGNVVKCGDTIVMTEKAFVENRDKSRTDVERILRDNLQCDILFLPWDKKEKYGHSDGIIHYAGEGRVLMNNYQDYDAGIAQKMEKRLAKKFDVITLNYNAKRKHYSNWAYINLLQTDKLIMVPQLGLEEDEQALEQISAVFAECEVIGIPALEAVRKGGALNCISWNIKDNGTLPRKYKYPLYEIERKISELFPEFMECNLMQPIRTFMKDSSRYPSQKEIKDAQHAVKSMDSCADTNINRGGVAASIPMKYVMRDGTPVVMNHEKAHLWHNYSPAIHTVIDMLNDLTQNSHFEFLAE